MSKFKFSPRSKQRLQGVHPALVDVVEKALAYGVMDFSVVEGLRTIERQRELLAQGATRTLNSKHLLQSDGWGHAVDLYPYPIDMARVNRGDAKEVIRFGVLNGLMQAAAHDLGVKITWGYDWDRDGETLDHSFSDGPHWQLEK